MLITRTIPTLLLDGPGLVKGTGFQRHQYVGDPVNIVRIFNEKEVDELVVLDISARRRAGNPNFALLAEIAGQAFMPFAYGGALDSLRDIEAVLRLGAEKVVLNTSFFENPSLAPQVARSIGSQSLVVSIDVKRNRRGRPHVFTHSGRHDTRDNPVDAARRAEELGAGEILLCSIDREGTASGYDLEVLHQVCQAVTIPVIAAGGAASVDDLRRAVNSGAAACAAGDMFTFRGKFKAVLITYPTQSELEAVYRGCENG